MRLFVVLSVLSLVLFAALYIWDNQSQEPQTPAITSLSALNLPSLETQESPFIKEVTEEYLVKPTSFRDLMPAINFNAPVGDNGAILHGYTTADIYPKYQLKATDQGCRVNDFAVFAEITYTLPLLDKSVTDPAILTVWSKFYPAIAGHEKGHGEIAVKTAQELQQEMQKLTVDSSCSKLEYKIDAITEQVNANGHKQQVGYDLITNHGKYQGAFIGDYLNVK